MPGNTCIVCRSTKVRDSSVSFHRFPKERSRRQRWIEALDLTSIAIKDYHRVCSRHFVDADASRDPQLNIGRHFASPKKQATDRNRRANRRESIRSNSRLSLTASKMAAIHLKQSLLLRHLLLLQSHHRL